MLFGLLNLGNTTFESNTANKLGGGLHGQVAKFNMQDTLTSFSGNLANINAQSMYLQATAVTFEICQPGYYIPLTLPTAVNYDFIGCPIICPNGTYAPLIEARTYCSLCPYGAYCPNTDQDKVNCEPGKFSEQQAKTTEIDACRICNQGQYQSESGKAYCLDCSRGQSQNISGSNNCTLCSPGMYNQITKANRFPNTCFHIVDHHIVGRSLLSSTCTITFNSRKKQSMQQRQTLWNWINFVNRYATKHIHFTSNHTICVVYHVRSCKKINYFPN